MQLFDYESDKGKGHLTSIDGGGGETGETAPVLKTVPPQAEPTPAESNRDGKTPHYTLRQAVALGSIAGTLLMLSLLDMPQRALSVFAKLNTGDSTPALVHNPEGTDLECLNGKSRTITPEERRLDAVDPEERVTTAWGIADEFVSGTDTDPNIIGIVEEMKELNPRISLSAGVGPNTAVEVPICAPRI